MKDSRYKEPSTPPLPPNDKRFEKMIEIWGKNGLRLRGLEKLFVYYQILYVDLFCLFMRNFR